MTIELNRIYNEDCIVGMRRIPDKSVDLIVTDPPYLMNYRSNRRTATEKFRHLENDVDAHGLIADYIAECYRILKDDTAIYMFCSWHHIDFFKIEFEKHFKLKNLIVWNKNVHGTGDLKGSYGPKHELILFGHKGRSLLREKRLPDVIDCAKVPAARLTHPTEKPVELLKTLVTNSSDPDAVVFDGFAGTGSLPQACLETGRNYMAFELDAEYAGIACRRLSTQSARDAA
ncbi:site-specific DNA-methyltransferase (adenine-specific) [Fontibacillus phaseoli]|uniref:Methyltransferase n=1 Tax=Fontibacillus phaseoli TaxID=1416533 RepID=A0A369BPE1_9BACL|nr:DNA methyltransferase [Fontibacillus phaseoli]RCX22935.1 site-specific DNA-methyltransferase (adenine-specific) [Fontibacillus phaseoli]